MSGRHLQAILRRRLPDVAFFDDLFGDDEESTVTIETPIPGPNAGGGGVVAPPTMPHFEPPEFRFEMPTFTPPPPPQRSPEAEAAYQHALAAMEGRLPIPESLTADLDRQQAILQQSLAKTLGPGWQTDTAGVQTMAEFSARRTAAEDAARHGNTQITANILDGLLKEEQIAQQFANQAAFEQFRAQVGFAQQQAAFAQQSALEAFRAEQEGALAAYAVQNRPAGVERTVTRTGGGGSSGLASAAGGILGIGTAAVLGGSKKPWWLQGDDTESGSPTPSTISNDFGVPTSMGLLRGTDPYVYEPPALGFSGVGTDPTGYTGYDPYGEFLDLADPSSYYIDPTYGLDFESFSIGGFSDPSIYEWGGLEGFDWGMGDYDMYFDWGFDDFDFDLTFDDLNFGFDDFGSDYVFDWEAY